MYCPASGIFFTPVNKLGMVIHEIWKVSNLPISSMPYEEYFPCVEELTQMEKDKPVMYETYKEVICYLYICLDLYPSRMNINSLKTWR